jgi:threonine efflux protein
LEAIMSTVDYLPLLGSLVVVDLLAAMSPGPNFILVTQTAAALSRRHAAGVVVGLVAANVVWCLAVVFGLAAVFELAPWLFGLVKILGGLYLVHLGIQLWRAAERPVGIGNEVGSSLSRSVGRGFVTNITNPKSVIYFGSVFSVFLSPEAPPWVQLAAVGIVLANTIVWYGAVAFAFSATSIQRRYAAIRRIIDRVAGVVLGAFGARLILVRD